MVDYWNFIYIIYKGFGGELNRLGLVDLQVEYIVDIDVLDIQDRLLVLYIIYMDIVFYIGAGWLKNKKKTINGWLIV